MRNIALYALAVGVSMAFGALLLGLAAIAAGGFGDVGFYSIATFLSGTGIAFIATMVVT